MALLGTPIRSGRWLVVFEFNEKAISCDYSGLGISASPYNFTGFDTLFGTDGNSLMYHPSGICNLRGTDIPGNQKWEKSSLKETKTPDGTQQKVFYAGMEIEIEGNTSTVLFFANYSRQSHFFVGIPSPAVIGVCTLCNSFQLSLFS